MAEQALYPAVNLRAATSHKPHTLRGGKKCLDLYQTQLLCSKHADHPSSACPLQLLQAHLALESTPPLRLILRWTRVPVEKIFRIVHSYQYWSVCGILAENTPIFSRVYEKRNFPSGQSGPSRNRRSCACQRGNC